MPDIFVAQNNNKKTENLLSPTETSHKVGISEKHEKKIDHHNKNRLERGIKISKKISFSNQKEDEEIILFLRAHFITNFPWITISVILIILPIIILIISNFIDNSLPFVTAELIFILILFYYLITFAYALINFMKWFYNILIITNLGIVDIDYSGLLYHDVAFTKLNLIEDVNYIKTGFLRSLFNFGDVFIQTAGGKENLEGIGIPNPSNAAHIIADSIGKGEGSG